MCLHNTTSNTTDIRKPLSREVKTGWKIYWKGSEASRLCSLIYGGNYKIGRWYIDSKIENIGTLIKYPPGFHIYTTRRAARNRKKATCDPHDSASAVIKKVEYSHVVAEGTEWSDKVVVARKIKILDNRT